MNKTASRRISWFSFITLRGVCLLLCVFTLLLGAKPASAQTAADDPWQEGYQFYVNAQYEDALNIYNEITARSPESAKAFLWKAKCHDKLGDRPAAIWALKKAVRLDPGLWGAKYLLAKLSQGVPDNYPSQGNLSLDFQDLDIRQAVFILAKETGLNLVPGNALNGRITLSLTDVSTSDALQAVLEAARATILPQGSLLKVLPTGEQFEVVETSPGSLAKTYRIDYVPSANVVESLKSLLPSDASVTISSVKDTNYIFLQGPAAIIKQADSLIRNIDTPPQQVMVEAKVIEMKIIDNANLGTDLKGTRPQDQNDKAQTLGLAGRPTDTGAQGLYAQILSTNVEAYLSALSNRSDYNLVASPRITTLSNKPANILIGSKYGYKTAIITDTSTTQQIQFLSVGTSLSITPSVTKDGFIKMLVAPKVSEGQVVNELPQENTTETANEVMVRDGQTIVIGGLIKSKEVQGDIGTPFLMNLPLIGSMFRKTVTSLEKTELLVFITPHILTPETLNNMSKETADMEKRSADKKLQLLY